MGNIEFNSANFVKHLGYMGVGMLAIVIVIGAIILVTMLLNNATRKKMETKTKVLLGVVGLVLVAALVVSLVLFDGTCKHCIKEGDFTFRGESYCKEHYAEVNEGTCDLCDEDGAHVVDDGSEKGRIFCDEHYIDYLKNAMIEG